MNTGDGLGYPGGCLKGAIGKAAVVDDEVPRGGVSKGQIMHAFCAGQK